MATSIRCVEAKCKCPICGGVLARVIRHRIDSPRVSAECSHCAFGESDSQNEDMALARYRGKCLTYGKIEPLEIPIYATDAMMMEAMKRNRDEIIKMFGMKSGGE